MVEMLRATRITPQLNTRRVFEAWYQASGAAQFTSRLFFRSGTLFVTTNSSVARSQLAFQKEALTEKMNDILAEDALFDMQDGDHWLVKEIRLK